VGSIAKVLRDLDDVLKYVSCHIFPSSHASPLFNALQERIKVCESSLISSLEEPVVAKSLSLVLNLQLDNACFDNKNRYTLCFLLLLLANGVFREVYVNFMLVSYTHDDIDAFLSHWSMKLRKQDYPTIPLLMKSFMDAKLWPAIPYFIKEVLDFKGFIDSCICKKGDPLEGHTAAQQYLFHKNTNGWPLMRCKLYYTIGEPNALPPQQMQNHPDIVKGIQGFIDYWESLSAKDITREYWRSHE
jgi:hypothetical protein